MPDKKKEFSEIFKELKYTLFFACALIIFSDFIYKNYYDLIINPILSKVNSNYLVDIVFIVFFIFLCISTIKKVKKGYYVKFSQFLFSLIVIIFYSYYRITKSEVFLSFKIIESVKYFDALFASFFIPVLLKIISFFKNESKNELNNNQLLIDNSISNGNQDILDRQSKAIRIYKEIIQLKTDESIAFGIVGAWGSGKTSFLNLIKENFNKHNNKDNIIIDFNPWLNISIDSIVQDYFNTLENELKKYSVDISKTIKKYGNSVLDIHKSNFTESLLKSTNLIFETSLTDEYKRLNELLNKLNKRVIIFIDDFDRLQPNEIFEILKLIRNTGGFDSFTYIVAYDRDYLVKSLKKHNIPKPKKFSEKIFLKEVELLPITNSQINSYLSNQLINRFKKKEKEIKDLFENDISKYYPRGTFKSSTWSLKNLRDVKRFINSFVIDYNEIKDEVLFRDYFILKLLKFKYYNIYSLLFTNRDDFVEQEKYSSSGNKNLKYVLKKTQEDSRSSVYNVFDGSKLKDYISKNLSYDENELNTIASLFNSLFANLSSLKDNLSISYEINYYKYFRDEMSLENISIVEFRETMALDFEDVKAKMREWYQSGRGDSIKYYLNDVKVYELKNRAEYEKYIKAMFYLANFESEDIRGRSKVFGFDFNILWNNIDSHNYRIAETFYNNSNIELSNFFKSILNAAKPPYEYESLFCYNLYNRFNLDSTIVDKETMKYYLVKFFEDYTNTITETDRNFWKLFHNCCVASWEKVSGNSFKRKDAYLDEAKEVFKNAMKKNLDYFLVIFINPQSPFRHEKRDDKLGISDLSLSIFDTHENFIKFLKSKEIKETLSKPSVFLNEFIEFAEEVVKQGKMIPYEFKYDGVNKRLRRLIDEQNY